MTSVTYDENYDPIWTTTVSVILSFKDAVTKRNVKENISCKINPTNYSAISKANNVCVLPPFPMPTTIKFSLDITSKNYIPLNIIVENNKFSDKVSLLKQFDVAEPYPIPLGLDKSIPNPSPPPVNIPLSETKFIPAKNKELFLHPSPCYVFPPYVYALYGTINGSSNKNTRYKISSEVLEQKTVSDKNGQFVLFIHDELVNYSTIVNSDVTSFSFNMKIEKITDGIIPGTEIFNDIVIVSTNSKSINLGTFSGGAP